MKLLKYLVSGFLMVTFALSAQAQIAIKGKVIDKTTQKPLYGAQIVVNGTTTGTITNADGEFTLRMPANRNDITVTFIGYRAINLNITDKTSVEVELEEDVQMLDEVIAVGYMTNTKREVTSAISSLSAENLTGFNTASVEQAIQGLVPGVQIGQSNGTPGSPMIFNIRGISTITAGSAPLCIIDDAVIEDGLNTLNMNDIANISILKDASSTAIYGASGANGVVIITTKSGRKSAPVVNFETKIGLTEVERYYKMMNNIECMELLDEANTRYWSLPGFDPNLNTDWQKAITRQAMTQTYSLSLRGGEDRFTYSLSGSLFDQPGVVLNTEYKRYNFRAKFDYNVTKWLKVHFTVAPNYVNKQEVRDRGQQGVDPVMTRALQMPPMFPVYYNGTYWTQNNFIASDLVADPRDPDNPAKQPPNSLPLQNIENPVKLLDEQSIRTISRKSVYSLGFDVTFIPGLVFKPRLSLDMGDSQARQWRSAAIGAREGRTTDGDARLSISNYTNWENENVLTYNKTFCQVHKLTAVAGITFGGKTVNNSSATARGYGSDALSTINGGTIFTASDLPYLQDYWSSVYARANYTYKERYMLSLIMRVDGSSKFGLDKRFGMFPSVSGGWIASDEKFMEWAQRALSILKFRASWGLSGNNSIQRYRYISFLNSQNYVFDGAIANGFAVGNIANPNLAWEEKESVNLGTDLGLFNNRLFFTLDLYRDVTSNMLLDTNIPATLGQPTMTMNIGSVENRGLEITANVRVLSGRNFSWSIGYNASFNRNKVLSLSTSGDAIYDGYDSDSNITIVGQPIGMFYGRVFKGVYMSWEEIRALAADPNSGLAFDPKTIPGDWKFIDLNGDGVMDDDDRTIIGSPHPRFIMGFTSNFSYRNFSFGFLLNGQYGNQIYNYTLHPMARAGNSNAIKAFTNRYKNENDRGNGWYGLVSNRTGADADLNKFSNYQLEDGSYLRIRNVSLGYTFPRKIVRKTGLTDLKITLNADNLYTFTHYTGMNVEAEHYGEEGTTRATALGLDYTSYPTPRTYTLGISVTF